jgi:transcriptional regulator with XRE-family HTH domain
MENKELRKLRLTLDITQEQMAEKLGVSLPMYSLYERGKTVISKPVQLLAAKIHEEHEGASC